MNSVFIPSSRLSIAACSISFILLAHYNAKFLLIYRSCEVVVDRCTEKKSSTKLCGTSLPPNYLFFNLHAAQLGVKYLIVLIAQSLGAFIEYNGSNVIGIN